MAEKDKIILIGAGGHALSVIDVIEWGLKYEIGGFLDLQRTGKICQYEILGNDDFLESLQEVYNLAFISIGKMERRIVVGERFGHYPSFGFPRIISPFAHVSLHAEIADGTFIGHNAAVNSHVTIDEHCIINTGAIVEHGVRIEKYCHIAPGAIVLGDCQIGRASFIGAGAVIKQGSIVPPNSFIKKGFDYDLSTPI